MTKTYRKTATIQADQFDGSEEMIKRYNVIREFHPSLGTDYMIKTLEGNMYLNESDWIATGVYGEHWSIRDRIFRKTYEEVTEDD